MNQLPTGAATRIHHHLKTKVLPLPTQHSPRGAIGATLARKVAVGLQLTRASTIALTRLQLALAGGDRRQAMAAIDRLHALDGEIENLVEHLPELASDDPADEVSLPGGEPSISDGPPLSDEVLTSLSKLITDQKLALAFEKLALASGIAGPDLVSTEHVLGLEGKMQLASASDGNYAERATPGGRTVGDWYGFPEVQHALWDRIPTKVWGILAAVLLILALVTGTAVLTMM